MVALVLKDWHIITKAFLNYHPLHHSNIYMGRFFLKYMDTYIFFKHIKDCHKLILYEFYLVKCAQKCSQISFIFLFSNFLLLSSSPIGILYQCSSQKLSSLLNIKSVQTFVFFDKEKKNTHIGLSAHALTF